MTLTHTILSLQRPILLSTSFLGFYEGGGITRHVWMNTADPLSIQPWGAYFPASVTGDITSGPLGAMGPQTAASALINAYVDIQNQRATSADTTLVVTVMDASGATVATSSTKQTLTSGGWARVTPSITWNNVNLWNTESTYMYTVRADVVDNGASGAIVDSVTVPIGVRNAIWTSNQGFILNGFKVPVKGFSQHQDYAGCGEYSWIFYMIDKMRSTNPTSFTFFFIINRHCCTRSCK